VICSGEALAFDLQERYYERVNASLDNLYGPTEASVDVTWWACRPGHEDRVVPIGRPIANTQIHLLGDVDRLVGVGVAGELHIGGVGLARGYVNRPELTAERFIPNAFSQRRGERLYRTGDLARYQQEGVIEYLGRIDHQVKIRGNRIELGEIEAALVAAPGIREAVVMAREDHGAEKRLVAYLVCEGQAAPAVSELRSSLKQTLPEYMIPSAMVMLEKLPLTPNGKVDRKALPAPDAPGTRDDRAPCGPRDPVELRLLEIWEEVLGVSPIGVGDNFFDLGGHSLLAIRLVSAIAAAFGVRLPLDALFQEASVERLARIVRREVGVPRSIVVPIQGRGSKPPLFCVHPGSGYVFGYAGLARRLGGEQPFYGLQDPSLYGDGEAGMSLEERARRYVEAVKEVQSEGPYYLGGWSFGGHVAFEMAQQLRRQGEEVALLAMLDTAAPFAVEPGLLDEVAMLATLVADFPGVQGVDAGELEEELRRLEPSEQMAYAKEKVREHTGAGGGEESLGRLLALFKSRLRVVEEYRAEVYEGQITLLRASEGSEWKAASAVMQEVMNDPARGWGELTTEPVEVYEVPGSHATMCREPHVEVLAARLKACLDPQPATNQTSKEPPLQAVGHSEMFP
ncbi:MAG TPA: thioesterase domain-containing protein, partial [Blastocatellia bacterium]|nr:thioesterase domain-containing protein [Blastocatellia bacterium]